MKRLIVIGFLVCLLVARCLHSDLSQNATIHPYDDHFEKRLLQTSTPTNMRIHPDFFNLQTGDTVTKNLIKRITNINVNYFHNLIKLPKENKIFFPADKIFCGKIPVPGTYKTDGVEAEFAIIVGNEESNPLRNIAQSIPCSQQLFTKRPQFGMVLWNNQNLKFDQQGIQQLIFVGIHEIMHLLGFSPALFPLFPTGNPLKIINDEYYLSTPAINREVFLQYGCANGNGMKLQDQDGGLEPSHWEKHDIGNECMIAANRKQMFTSRLTLALLESTGWYSSINYDYAQPFLWGKNKGCAFLDIDNCEFDEFCSGSDFDCDWEGTGIGRCGIDALSGTCSIYRYFTNTICIDENYQLKNLNSHLEAFERGGYQSKCFKSDFRALGKNATILNNRCYLSVCSFSANYIYVLVGSSILVCLFPNQVINSPPGLEGTFECPSTFQNYCDNKRTCAFACNKNGACINGQCLCQDSLELQSTCLDVDLVVSNRRLLNEVLDPIMEQESENTQCLMGTVMDPLSGECQKCQNLFGCDNCTLSGCMAIQ